MKAPWNDVFTLPAGTYRLGDPCYSVPNDRWLEWLEAADFTNALTDLYATLDGYPIVGLRTKYGDGVYPDNHGNMYPVDAGLIGLVPYDMPDIQDNEGQRLYVMHEFTEPFEVWADGVGGLHFGKDITVYTGEDTEGF